MANSQKISFLGPGGSYCHIAAQRIFKAKAELIPAATITSAFHDLSVGLVDYAVIPVENSIAGGVAESVEALQKIENVFIVNEFILPIDHCLLKIDKHLTNITEIRAHHMALNQCMDFIRQKLPNAEILPSSSNSAAAKSLKEKALNGEDVSQIAVIASALCAEIYDLQIVQENINDAVINETRFWVVAKKPADYQSQAKNKTTILFQTKDEPGSLQTVLRLFAVNNVNLSRIESRPAKRNIGEYLFLIDFDLHSDQSKYVELMRQVKNHFTYYKWLGSYSLIEA